MFNYKDTVNSINNDDRKNEIKECDCKESKFCDPNHGHIVTGDLRLVQNSKLRDLLSKGPKFREKEPIKWNKVFDSINTGILDYKTRWANDEKVDEKLFADWTSHFLDNVKKQIASIKMFKKFRGFREPMPKKVLNRPDVKQDLKTLICPCANR